MTGKTLLVGVACLVGLGVVALTVTLGNAPAPTAGSALSQTQRTEMRDVVRDYLVDNPEIIVEAIETMKARRQQAEQERTRQAITERQKDLIAAPDDPSIGPDAASVTLVEFFDYQCPYCKRMTDTVMKLIEQDSGLRIVFKEFPILGDPSILASRAALAAHMQGKYIEFHDAMMKQRGKPTQQSIDELAQTVGLDVAQLHADMNSPKVRDAINANYALAHALAITGTPAFVVGDTILPGAVPIEQLQQLIEKARDKAG